MREPVWIRNGLYIYPWAKNPVHDDDPTYRGCVPFCRSNLNYSDLHIVEDPNSASYFYMGQFNDNDSLDINPEYYNGDFNHIADIEGDWLGRNVPHDWLKKYILCINGVKKDYRPFLKNIIVRPTFSKLLMSLVKKKASYIPIYNRAFSFTGFPDPLGIRKSMIATVKHLGLSHYGHLTDKWKGASDSSDDHSYMLGCMEAATFSLCPRGTGVDSARYLESCFLGRFPIIIGDNIPFGHEYHLPFYIQIDPNDMEDGLSDLSKMSIAEIDYYGKNSVRFFNEYVREYFRRPTQYFMEQLNENSKYFG